jgi:hypothetical protein
MSAVMEIKKSRRRKLAITRRNKKRLKNLLITFFIARLYNNKVNNPGSIIPISSKKKEVISE